MGFGKLKDTGELSDKVHMDVTHIALGGPERAQNSLENTGKRLATGGAPRADGAADSVDLSTEMVAKLAARQQFQFNARVIRTADQMQKSLLDVLG